MKDFWIVRESDMEIVASWHAKNHRDALVAFLRDEKAQGLDGSITQDKEGGRYYAEINGERYYPELDR